MNFAKLVVFGVIAAVVIGGIMFFTRTDYADPVAVATAYTKAIKSNNMDKASKYYQPDKADAWKTAADTRLAGMKSGEHDRFFEGIPADPQFGAPATNPRGVTTITTADNGFELDLIRVDDKWYVSRGPI